MTKNEAIAFEIGVAMEYLGQALKLAVRKGEYEAAASFLEAAQTSTYEAMMRCADSVVSRSSSEHK